MICCRLHLGEIIRCVSPRRFYLSLNQALNQALNHASQIYTR